MRIVFVSTYPPSACGIATYAMYLTEGLRCEDRAIDLSICAEGQSRSGTGNDGRVRQVFRHDEDYVHKIVDSMVNAHPDVVHVQHEYGIFGIDNRFHRLLSRLKEADIRTVVTLHTVHTRSSIDVGCAWRYKKKLPADLDIEAYQRGIAELADRVIVHQDVPIRQVLLRCGVSSETVQVIPHGTRIESARNAASAKARWGLSEDHPLIVGFGYFERSKNARCLIEAFAQVVQAVPSARLWLSGFLRNPVPELAEYQHACRQLTKRLGLAGHIVWSDRHLAEQEVAGLLGGADIACFPYDEDTRASSGAAHRAIGFRVPIVVSRIPKFDEIREISDELLIPPNASDALARLLLRLLTDREFRNHVRERVTEFAERTAWGRIAGQHYQLYREVVQWRRQRPIGVTRPAWPSARSGSAARAARATRDSESMVLHGGVKSHA